MSARSLVQALEGVQFPCDRSRLVEYARRQEVGPRSLEALEAIPDREYRDLHELFSALPSKGELARRRTSAARGANAERGDYEAAQDDAAMAREAGAREAGAREARAREAGRQHDEPEEEVADPMAATMQLWLCGMQAWPEWVRLSQRLWFPWLR